MDIDRIRSDFPALKEWTYLDTSFVGLIPNQVKEGYDEWLRQWHHFSPEEGKPLLSTWLEDANRVREIVADFMGVKGKEIAFTMCTGSGLNIVVNGLDWEKGDNAVFPEWEHNPLDTHTIRRCGVEHRAVPARGGGFEPADLEKAVDDRTRLVQVSEVGYINGFRFDLREVSEIAHEHGAKVLVDATQSVGALMADYRKDDVDFVSAAPYKYLMGPAGLAFLYVEEENIPGLVPDRIGWKNQIWEGARAEEPAAPDTAEKFEYGTLNFQGIHALGESLAYLNRVGMDAVEERVLSLSSHLHERIEELGKDILTPEGTESPIVSFAQDGAVKLARRLMSEKIKVTGREAHGSHMRVSVHFYNNEEDIDRFIQKIEE